jgi:polyisoprenoid-binding protein YceI
MKKIILITLFFLVNISSAQKEMATAAGFIKFEASVPLYEEVTATNKTTSCVLNLKSGALSSEVQMKDFEFKLSLMKEHFNKKYLETDSYPKAYFKGTIEGFNWNIIDTNPKEFKLKGVLKLHGKSKKISTLVFLKKIENRLEMVSDFKIKLKDFNVEIPELLSLKVAETVHIESRFLLQ